MDYIALSTYLLVMIVTPGPNNIMITASGANFGYRATLPHIFGIITGNSSQAALACFGLGVVFMQFPVLHQILEWVGLAYMLYLAWKMLGIRTGKGKNKEKNISKPLTMTQAALFQWVNPKAWIIYITVASLFMPKTGEVIIPTLVIVIMSALITFAGTTIWASFGSIMRNLLKNPRNQKVFNISMAALLLITAVLIVIK